MPSSIITTDDLFLFKQELVEELKAVLSKSHHEPKRWLRSPEVRKMLAISPGTLQNLRINGTLPYSKVKGKFYYKVADIEQLLQDNYYNHNFKRDGNK